MEETGRRQQAGFACEECRRRKARCDRARPKCGNCLETDTVCIVIDKTSQRGPKKGHMTALRSRIGLSTFILHPQQLCFSNFDASTFLPSASRGYVPAIFAFELFYQHLRVHRKPPVAIEPTRRLQDGQWPCYTRPYDAGMGSYWRRGAP